MKSLKPILFVLALISTSLSCNLLTPDSSNDVDIPSDVTNLPVIDFETPAEPLNVTVELDEAYSISGMFSPNGSTMSLTAGDGTVFTLDVPPNALEVDTAITMTALKSITGAPLDAGAVFAVQLEPSGLLFNELVTLTIVPAKEIPIESQIMFGYEGSGQDYHLAAVDPTSKDIKIKLMEFSGAGVGSGSDAAWAANLQIQASNASTRLWQKFGEFSQLSRQERLLGAVDSDNMEFVDQMVSTLDDFEDQVVLKEIAAAELDCQFAPQAVKDLLFLGRIHQLLVSKVPPGFDEKINRLLKIIEECQWTYRIVGGLDDWQTDTVVCNILTPFTLTGGGINVNFSGGTSGTYTYSGSQFGASGSGSYTISLPEGMGKPGTMTGRGEGAAGGATGSGTEFYTLTPLPAGSCP